MAEIISPENRARAALHDAARRRGHSLAQLSRLLGRNAAYLQQYVARGSPRHLDESDLRTLADFLGISPRSISTREFGHEDMLGEAGWRAIPRLALEASAGPGVLPTREIPYDIFRISDQWLLENGLRGADLSAIRVEGDSMEPLLRSGDEILVDRAKRQGEGVFVVRIGDALHVKKVQASAPGRIALVSENKAYAALELPREEVDVIGRVVWKGGRI